MLATLGFLSVAVLLALILTKRASPLVALVAVPIVAALVAGQASSLGGHVTSGIQQTAPVAATFVFAIIYFGVMSDAGMLDPAIAAVLRAAGSDPVRIVVGSAALAALVHLDGSGAATFLITIPALLPLYHRLGLDKRVLACVVAMGAGIMNMVPWGGPLLRAAASLHVSASDLFIPLLPAMVAGLAFTFFVAVRLGRREARRLANLTNPSNPSNPSNPTNPTNPSNPSNPTNPTNPTYLAYLAYQQELSDDARRLRRPRMLWPNVLLTLAVLAAMVTTLVPTALAFMAGAVVALTINYPQVAEQRARIDAHAKAALMMATILLAAGAFTGIMKGTGMLPAMAAAAVSVVPPAQASHVPLVLAALSMPLSLFFDPDSFYFAVLPVIAEVAGSGGVPAVQVGQAALLGQMTTGFPVSPLTPSTFLLVGLTGLELAEHQRFTMPWLFAASIVMTCACLAVGVFTL